MRSKATAAAPTSAALPPSSPTSTRGRWTRLILLASRAPSGARAPDGIPMVPERTTSSQSTSATAVAITAASAPNASFQTRAAAASPVVALAMTSSARIASLAAKV